MAQSVSPNQSGKSRLCCIFFHAMPARKDASHQDIGCLEITKMQTYFELSQRQAIPQVQWPQAMDDMPRAKSRAKRAPNETAAVGSRRFLRPLRGRPRRDQLRNVLRSRPRCGSGLGLVPTHSRASFASACDRPAQLRRRPDARPGQLKSSMMEASSKCLPYSSIQRTMRR